jgi:hypothetical protein
VSARKCQRRRDGSLTPAQIDYVEINKLDQARQRANEPEARGAPRRRTAKSAQVGAPARSRRQTALSVGRDRAVKRGVPAALRSHAEPFAGTCGSTWSTWGTCSSATTLGRIPQRIDNYRAARGSDIARGDTLASSGLTGRPPAGVCEGTARRCVTRARRCVTRARRCVTRARPGGPPPDRLRSERSSSGCVGRTTRGAPAMTDPARFEAPAERARAAAVRTRSDRSSEARGAPLHPRRP